MRIFIVCNILLDGRNAQTIHILELLGNLAKRNDVVCFAPKSKNIKYKYQEIIYISVLNIPIVFSASYRLGLFFSLFYHCIKARPDAIYVRYYTLPLSQLIISKLFRIPYIVEINGLVVRELRLLKKSKLKICITKLSEIFSYKHAKKIVAVTRGLKEELMRLYNIPDEKIIVIENGANTDLFRPMDQEEIEKEFEFDQDANYVCFVGALAPWQGVGYLVKASPLILKEFPGARFLIVGDGLIKEELMKLAEKTGVSDKFIFTGVVPYEEVPKYINESDVCVAPIIGERIASPIKIYEYAACRKPVVSSRIYGLEFIERKNIGILVQPENSNQLMVAITKLLKDRELRDKMGKNGRKYVVENRSWEAVAKAVEKVVREVVE